MSTTCKNCGRLLPEDQFELYPSGTRRRVCRHCHYVLHGRRAKAKWLKKQKIMLFVK